jgi:subtilisin family serine protease
VEALRPLDAQVAQARQIYLQLHAMGVDRQMIEEEGQAIGSRLEYGLNLDFDPRDIVGDDYADPTERIYGNADVAGPDPSHGTAVASLIAAERDNGVGIDGVTNDVRIMAVRAVPDGDERDKDVANAIRYAVDNGAHVINMSFGKAYSPYKEVVDQAVAYADERGVLMVHAAGNDATDLAVTPNFPSDLLPDGQAAELWLEVGASAWQGPDQLAAVFTNYGREQVDVFAPGVALVAAKPGDAYGPSDGTSVAAPVVSGIAALLMAHFPEFTAAEVRAIILETATPLGEQTVVLPGEGQGTARFGDLSVTGGIVNAAAAVQRAAELGAGR